MPMGALADLRIVRDEIAGAGSDARYAIGRLAGAADRIEETATAGLIAFGLVAVMAAAALILAAVAFRDSA